MNQAIENTLKMLGEAIAKQVGDAEARAEKAEADRAEAKRLVALMAAIFANDDEAALPEPPEPILEIIQPTTSKDVAQAEASQPKKSMAKSIAKSHATSPLVTAPMIAQPIVGVPARHTGKADAAILAAMANGAWMTALAIWYAIGGDNAPITRAAVYQRMPILVARNHDVIEQHPSQKKWRLKPSGKAPRRDNDIVPATVAPTIIAPSESTPVSETPPDFPSLAMLPQMLLGDCLNVMRSIPDQSVDLILGDLPYGTTRMEFDQPIDLKAVWAEYRRIIKPKGNIVQFGCQPFTNTLINSAPDLFKYTMVWDKGSATGFPQAANKPLKAHEDIVLFEAHEDIVLFSKGTNISGKRSKRRAVFNPQGVTYVRRKYKKSRKASHIKQPIRGGREGEYYDGMTNCPRSILRFDKVKGKKGSGQHPFAKPVNLLEYLIRTYSDIGAVVLDNTMGEGSAMIAAMRTGRQGIGIEMEDKWFARANMLVGNEHEAMLAAGVKFEAAKVMSANDLSDKII